MKDDDANPDADEIKENDLALEILGMTGTMIGRDLAIKKAAEQLSKRI